MTGRRGSKQVKQYAEGPAKWEAFVQSSVRGFLSIIRVNPRSKLDNKCESCKNFGGLKTELVWGCPYHCWGDISNEQEVEAQLNWFPFDNWKGLALTGPRRLFLPSFSCGQHVAPTEFHPLLYPKWTAGRSNEQPDEFFFSRDTGSVHKKTVWRHCSES